MICTRGKGAITPPPPPGFSFLLSLNFICQIFIITPDRLSVIVNYYHVR